MNNITNRNCIELSDFYDDLSDSLSILRPELMKDEECIILFTSGNRLNIAHSEKNGDGLQEVTSYISLELPPGITGGSHSK